MRDAVSALMQQVAEQKEESRAEVVAGRERKARTKTIRIAQAALAGLALVVSLLLVIPRWQRPFAAPTGAEAEVSARRGIVFAAQLVEQHIRRNRQLPMSLSDLGVSLPGISYQRIDSSYVISTIVEGKTFALRRGDDLARFLAGP